MTPVVQTLLILNGATFLLELYSGGRLIEVLALWPLGSSGTEVFGESAARFYLWQLVTYSFLHGSVMHLLLNMYGLWLFGSRMEHVWGSQAFALYYFICVIGAGLVQLLVVTLGAREGGMYPTLGASGGVYGVLLAFGLTFPNERLILVFPPWCCRRNGLCSSSLASNCGRVSQGPKRAWPTSRIWAACCSGLFYCGTGAAIRRLSAESEPATINRW